MAILTVRTGGQFTTIAAAVAAAQPDDTIDVQKGTYTNDFPPLIAKSLTLQAVGGMVNMVATQPPPNGTAILDVGAAGVTVSIDGFSFSGATVSSSNGTGIRYEGGILLLTNDYFHDNQDGLLAASDPAGSITINHTEFTNKVSIRISGVSCCDRLSGASDVVVGEAWVPSFEQWPERAVERARSGL